MPGVWLGVSLGQHALPNRIIRSARHFSEIRFGTPEEGASINRTLTYALPEEAFDSRRPLGTRFALIRLAHACGLGGPGKNESEKNQFTRPFMNSTSQAIASPSQVVAVIVRYRWRWLVPALVATVVGGVYAVVRPVTWEASQALVLRNDAANAQETLGKFAQVDDMRAVQETILELLRSRGILAAALAKVGPESVKPVADVWPDDQDIEDLRDAIKLTPPKGAEFGKTEVFYLKVRAGDHDRSVALASALSSELETGYQKLRDAKAGSMVVELEQGVALASGDLSKATARLSDMERQVGGDLAELRILHDTGSAESVVRRTITEIRNELRQARSTEKSNQEFFSVLKAAQEHPERLVAVPSTLLESQPALRRLKDGLIDAQINTSQLLGRMSAEHPAVKAAKESEREINRHVHDELANAARAVEVDLRLAGNRIAMLEEQLATAEGRLETVAALRTPYGNLAADVKKRTELCERAQQRLADARASQATANAASLISRIDSPDAGTRPVGPSRAVIVLAGLVGGLLTGFGLVLLTVDPRELAKPVAAKNWPVVSESLCHIPVGIRRHENRLENVFQPNRSLSLAGALNRLAIQSTRSSFDGSR